MLRMPGLAMPVLGVLGLQNEEMGWGTQPDDVEPYLPPGASFVPLADSGHFVHIEQPRRVADVVLDFLGPPPSVGAGAPAAAVGTGTPAPGVAADTEGAKARVAPVRELSRGRARLALHALRAGDGPSLLLLHGLGERAPRGRTHVPRTLGRTDLGARLHRSRPVDGSSRRWVHR